MRRFNEVLAIMKEMGIIKRVMVSVKGCQGYRGKYQWIGINQGFKYYSIMSKWVKCKEEEIPKYHKRCWKIYLSRDIKILRNTLNIKMMMKQFLTNIYTGTAPKC
jgi:hypothetical protein